MKINLEYPPGATPLDAGALEQLKAPATTQGELNQYEAQNIRNAEMWARNNSWLRRELLSRARLLRLHEKMFGDVWDWAGEIRQRETNIGIEPRLIENAIYQLGENVKYRVENEADPWPELGVEFHHQLVSIHPFYNGNGRHTRLTADLLLEHNGQSRLPWGGAPLTRSGAKRDEYIAALQEADAGQLERLVRFALSS